MRFTVRHATSLTATIVWMVACAPPCPEECIDNDGDLYCEEVVYYEGVDGKVTSDGLELEAECVESHRVPGDDCNDDPTNSGFTDNPGSFELCGDGRDNDCDGAIDESTPDDPCMQPESPGSADPEESELDPQDADSGVSGSDTGA